jgi:predicted deacetylase
MVQFQKLTRNLFLTLHGYNVYHQQRQLSKFLMRYQQFASRAYCGAAGPVFKMASQQEKAFCVFRFEVSRSVITVQREFRARFRKDAPCVFSKPCTHFTHSQFDMFPHYFSSTYRSAGNIIPGLDPKDFIHLLRTC